MGKPEPSLRSEPVKKTNNSTTVPDWLNRIVTSLKLSGIRKQMLVHPCVIDGQKAIVYEKGLQAKDPEAYERLIDFAGANGFRLKEDQRSSFKSVDNDRRARVMPMMVLGASLLMQNAYAGTDKTAKSFNDNPEITSSNLILDKNPLSQIADYETEQELVGGLLDWISNNSTFDYNTDEIPQVEKISTGKMHKIAFGKDMPKAMDQKSFQIYGLYNFKEKKVYILDTLDMKSEKGKAILLHELVHYMQYQQGHHRNVSCKNQLESLAYSLEARYLSDQDHEAGFTAGHISRVSRCS